MTFNQQFWSLRPPSDNLNWWRAFWKSTTDSFKNKFEGRSGSFATSVSVESQSVPINLTSASEAELKPLNICTLFFIGIEAHVSDALRAFFINQVLEKTGHMGYNELMLLAHFMRRRLHLFHFFKSWTINDYKHSLFRFSSLHEHPLSHIIMKYLGCIKDGLVRFLCMGIEDSKCFQ